MGIPKVLHHYTNIEALALILKNKTIRFNSLDNMDDLQEKESIDAKNIGKTTFVSSWTEIEEESIPMWKMYSSMKSGVRITMKANPFKLRPIDEGLEELDLPNVRIEKNDMAFKVLIPVAEMIKKHFAVAPNCFEGLLLKVEYVNDDNKLYPAVLCYEDGNSIIDYSPIGKYKNTSWSFQREWRYRLRMISHDILQTPEEQNKSLKVVFQNVVDGKYIQPFTHYDMQLDENAFSEMIVTMSPQISAGNRVIVSDLIEKYNPTAKVKESDLYGLL